MPGLAPTSVVQRLSLVAWLVRPDLELSERWLSLLEPAPLGPARGSQGTSVVRSIAF